jgi:radical SAM superfamily enzyme YgiQ (UPF0313 family)
MRLCDDFLSNPSRVHGIYRDPPPDLATLPWPRVDLMHIERYGSFYYPIIASRGCPEGCSFCFAKKMTFGYRTYPISHVIEQVRRRPSSINAGYFVDDNLPADEDYSRELFRALEREGLRFGMQARWEFARDPERLQQAKRAGCMLISSGYESINQETLNHVAKHATVESYRETIANIFQVGMLPSGNWMFGFDWDTPDTFERTLEFLDTTDLMHCSFTTEIPFPGTKAHARYTREGRMLTTNYDDFVGKDHVVVKPMNMTAEELQAGIRRLALAFYSPARSTRRVRRSIANPALQSFGHRMFKAPAFLGLNYYQLWQWHYRMSPSLQWLYQRVLTVNKYRYFSDLMRRSNYWSRSFEPARLGGPLIGDSPFHSQQGVKRGRRGALLPSREAPSPRA